MNGERAVISKHEGMIKKTEKDLYIGNKEFLRLRLLNCYCMKSNMSDWKGVWKWEYRHSCECYLFYEKKSDGFKRELVKEDCW